MQPAASMAGPVLLGPPVTDAVVTSLFGYRVDPLGGAAPEFHAGLDYGSPCGAGVQAAGAGHVIEAGWHPYGGGLRVVVDHGGHLQTTYNHLSVLEAPVGAPVQPGALLGTVGSTGNSTGCHLHFEVLVDAQKVDPLPWLRSSG